jgi:hypothetical protein
VTRRAGCVLLGWLLLAGAALGAGRPGVHHDVPRLTWLTPAFLPPDGLLTVGASAARVRLNYAPDGNLGSYDVWTGRLQAHWTPLPGVALSVGQEFRQYSNWFATSNSAATSGSGLADGSWRVAYAVPVLPSWLGAVGWAGGNLPTGSAEFGEGAFSPEAGVTLGVRVWRESVLPEMRLHAMVGRRWNGNEAEGFGAVHGPPPQPWYPQYPSAAAAGGDGGNDFLMWGVAVEFRKSSTALWLEYHEQLVRDDLLVTAGEEDQRVLAAGLRWGLEEGWALHADYQVGFHLDDLASAWFPRQPELIYTIGISRQFGFGGRDRDGDGVPDRRDACPDDPEDRDGFQDDDGCPDRDNDGDGIPDNLDGAPMDPEDIDGWFDHDGVPDPDNDGDGIPDGRDECPDEAEDFDGHRDLDGCPEEFVDTDGDGIADEDDLCPNSPEDFDGFRDGDGCPEPDNDLDGVDDVDDECPDEPEDYDGDRDEDGCPDGDEAGGGNEAPRPAPREGASGR